MLVIELFLLSSVSHQVFHHLPVHQRLPAEEVHFQISPVSGIGDQEIQRLFSDLEAHQRTSSMIFAFLCKTVFTCQVAVMGNMQTQRLYYRLALLHLVYHTLVNVRYKQLSCFGKLRQIIQYVLQIFCRINTA